MNLEGDELEFAISQYLDGHLSADLAGVLEERLAVDPAARELLRRYRQIHSTLAAPITDVHWDRALRETREKIAAHWGYNNAEPALRENGQIAAGYSVFSNNNVTVSPENLTGLHHFSNAFATRKMRRFAVPMALAASLLVAFTTIGIFVAQSKRTQPVVATVEGPKVEKANGPVIAEVSIGPAPSVASSGRIVHEDVVDRPSIVLIDRADNPPPDNDSIY